MVWVYGDPPFTKQERDVYLRLNKKLKNREYSEKIVKILSLFFYIKNHKFKDWKELQESVFFDKDKTQPVFDSKTAKTVFRLAQQKGGSQYPFINSLIESGFTKVGNMLPVIITEPVSLAYNGATGIFTTAVEYIPFADLVLEAGKSGAAVTTVAIENLAGAVGGAPAEVVAFLVTFVIAASAASVHFLERDFGGAIEQMFRAIPVVGTIMQTMLQKAEGIGSKVEGDYEKIMGTFDKVKSSVSGLVSGETPSLQGLKDKALQLKDQHLQGLKDKASELKARALPSLPATTAGKRLSTMRQGNSKWKKTLRRK